MIFLLTLLYDLALDVPSRQLSSCRILQSAVRALLFHSGQQLLFSLTHSKNTVLALVLAANCRPLVFTSSQFAAAPALKAVPYIILAKQVATELGYNTSGYRLQDALKGHENNTDKLLPLMHECLHWIRLAVAGVNLDSIFRAPELDEPTIQSLDALNTASLIGRMPAEILLPYHMVSAWIGILSNFKDLSKNWKNLDRLGEIITTHKTFCDRENETLERSLSASNLRPEQSNVISYLAEAERHLAHVHVAGSALFFAVMYGAYASSQAEVQPNQAMEVSDHIIDQLLSNKDDDPDRPSHRRFLEDYGTNRMDELERVLSNFITAVDTLTLNSIPYVGPSRTIVAMVLFTCKDIVEGNAARLKGWGKQQNTDLYSSRQTNIPILI